MADTAAHLVDRVLPVVPIRQRVFTLPYPLRYRCARNAKRTSEVLRAFLRSVFADHRRRARILFGVRKGQCGSVTFIQRFGSALNLTPHFHSLVLDGVYVGPSHDPGNFVAPPPPPRAPPLSPAIEVDREPVVGRSGFERTTAEATGDPGFEFDQTLSELRSSDEDV